MNKLSKTILQFSLAALISASFTLPLLAAENANNPAFPDRVLFKTSSGAKKRIQGRIQNYNKDFLQVLNGKNNELDNIPVRLLEEVHLLQSTTQQAAAKAVTSKDYQTASRLYDQACNNEKRNWARHLLLEQQIKVGLAISDYELAGSRFYRLLNLNVGPVPYALMPLKWAENQSSPPSAASWRESNREEMQLIGMSWFLLDESQQKKNETLLRRLVRSEDSQIRQLANAQRWRLYIASGRFSESELFRWESQVEQMEGSLRGGPYYLLGTAYATQLEHDRALTRWLWLPANRHPDAGLSAFALKQSADALTGLGLKKQAKILYTEILEDYPQTQSAHQIRLKSPRLNEADSFQNKAGPSNKTEPFQPD